MTDTRTTPLGRARPSPRIEPIYGTRAIRRARKRREAEARNAACPLERRKKTRMEDPSDGLT